MESKITSYKKLLPNTIAKFLSYFVLIGFIFIFILLIIKYQISDITNLTLTVCLSLIAGILLFYILRFICKSTIIETFSNDKLDVENTKKFTSRMNIFFIICTIFAVTICLGYFFFDSFLFANSIERAYSQYSFISVDYATTVINNIVNEYNNTFTPKVCYSLITELSLVVSFISLIPYSEKLIKKYNV